jgi:hypothetical protein
MADSALPIPTLLAIARTNFYNLPPMEYDLGKILREMVYTEYTCYKHRNPKYTHQRCRFSIDGTIDEKIAARLKMYGIIASVRTFPVTFGQHYTDGVLIPAVTRDVTKTDISWRYAFPEKCPPANPSRMMDQYLGVEGSDSDSESSDSDESTE